MTGEESKIDTTAKLIELTKENESLKTKLAAFEASESSQREEIAKRDADINRLNRLLVDNCLTHKDPNDSSSDPEKSPMDLYRETLEEMKKAGEKP